MYFAGSTAIAVASAAAVMRSPKAMSLVARGTIPVISIPRFNEYILKISFSSGNALFYGSHDRHSGARQVYSLRAWSQHEAHDLGPARCSARSCFRPTHLPGWSHPHQSCMVIPADLKKFLSLKKIIIVDYVKFGWLWHLINWDLKIFRYTAGVVGGLSTVAMCAPSDKFLYMGGPLAAGLGVVFAASVGSMFLPASTALGAGLYSISVYGGLLLISAFLLYDTQKVVRSAENYPVYGPVPFDPINQ